MKPKNRGRRPRLRAAQQGALDDKARYTAALQLIAHSENVTWTRLGGYLVLVGFLFSGIVSPKAPPELQVALPFFGMALSGLFVSIMRRSRAFVRTYVDEAIELEAGEGPMTRGMQSVTQGIGALHVAPFIPSMTSVLFLIALYPSMHRWPRYGDPIFWVGGATHVLWIGSQIVEWIRYRRSKKTAQGNGDNGQLD